jgi:uracil-DNA glycosylase family 4
MSDMRDYYLQNLGIGEIWKCRSTEDGAIDKDSAVLSSKLSTSLVGIAQKSDGALSVDSPLEQAASNLRALERQVQNCSKCASCVSFGRAEVMQMTEPSDASIEVLVVTEFAAPMHIDAQEKLIENILLALPLEKSRKIYRSSLLKSQSPASSQSDLDSTSIDACLPYLQQEIHLLRPRSLLIFGEFVANALLASVSNSELSNLRQNPVYFQDIPVIVTHSIGAILAQPELKREVWTDLCRLRKLTG